MVIEVNLDSKQLIVYHQDGVEQFDIEMEVDEDGIEQER